MYSVHEIFYAIQGEGFHTGMPAVFVRFSTCNLWSGKEEDRERALCKICDTTFAGTGGAYGGEYTAGELVDQILHLPNSQNVIFTGGEPLLHLKQSLVRKLQNAGSKVHVETNGTLKLRFPVDWVTISPKTKKVQLEQADEIKLLFPLNSVSDWEWFPAEHRYLQPVWCDDVNQRERNYWMAHTACCVYGWHLSVQSQKLYGAK